MYNAKELDNTNNKNEDVKNKCVGDRGYFDKAKNENLLTNKTSYIPTENIFY